MIKEYTGILIFHQLYFYGNLKMFSISNLFSLNNFFNILLNTKVILILKIIDLCDFKHINMTLPITVT